MPAPPLRPLATLWRLAWNGSEVACVVYRGDGGLELRLESGSATILAEPFEIRPRALARTHTLRTSLMSRGWRDVTGRGAPEPAR